MDKAKQKDYARRVAQANKTELVVLTYDIILEETGEAKALYNAGNIEEARYAMKRAQRFLGELMSVLDFRYSPAAQLLSLYEYVQRIFVKCDVSGECAGLENAERVIDGLRSAFDGIASEDKSGAVMENTQSVYAGLTYGKNSLNEMNLSDGSNRGFLA